jgi:hypothetical protein
MTDKLAEGPIIRATTRYSTMQRSTVGMTAFGVAGDERLPPAVTPKEHR